MSKHPTTITTCHSLMWETLATKNNIKHTCSYTPLKDDIIVCVVVYVKYKILHICWPHPIYKIYGLSQAMTLSFCQHSWFICMPGIPLFTHLMVHWGGGVSPEFHTSCFTCSYYMVKVSHEMLLKLVRVSHEMLLQLGEGFTWNVANILLSFPTFSF